MSITLHGSGLSPFVRKVMVAFDEKSLSYELQDTVPFPKTEELLAKSPLGKIPFMEIDGSFIPDSSVICAWLERSHPSPALYPADPVAFARALWLEEYADTKVAEVATTPFFQRFIQPNVFQQEPDNERVKEVMTNDLPPILDYLEGQLGDNQFLVNNQFSIADIAVVSPFVNMRVGQEDIDASRWGKFAAYVDSVLARPSFKNATAALPAP